MEKGIPKWFLRRKKPPKTTKNNPKPFLNWCLARMIKPMAIMSMGQERNQLGKMKPTAFNNSTTPINKMITPAVKSLLPGLNVCFAIVFEFD